MSILKEVIDERANWDKKYRRKDLLNIIKPFAIIFTTACIYLLRHDIISLLF